MILSNREIWNAREPLEKLIEVGFPMKVSISLAKLALKLNEQLKVIESVRIGLVKKYGEVSKDTSQQLLVEPEGKNFKKFASELAELMRQEDEYVIEKIKLPEEVDGKPVIIEPKILMALEKFIE